MQDEQRHLASLRRQSLDLEEALKRSDESNRRSSSEIIANLLGEDPSAPAAEEDDVLGALPSAGAMKRKVQARPEPKLPKL